MKWIFSILLTFSALSAKTTQRDIEAHDYVVIDFYADWCAPCRKFLPIFEEVAKEYKSKYYFLKLNIDQEKELSNLYKVSSIPTIVFIKNGKEVGRLHGSMSKESFSTQVDQHFKAF